MAVEAGILIDLRGNILYIAVEMRRCRCQSEKKVKGLDNEGDYTVCPK
jgi:hypothetical protein